MFLMTFRQLLILLLLFGSAKAAAFPEIPFCPLGGPPGWFNRIAGDNDRYYWRPPVHANYPQPYQPAYLPGYNTGYRFNAEHQPIYREQENQYRNPARLP